MAQHTQLCALYRRFCHPSQGKHDGDDGGVVGVGVRTRGGMVGPRRCIVVRGGRWRIVLVVLSLYCRRAGGRGHIGIVVREREMAMARVVF